MSTKLQILRHGHIIKEYESLEHLQAIITTSNNPIEIIASILTALQLYRSGVRVASFKVGSVRVRFSGGE